MSGSGTEVLKNIRRKLVKAIVPGVFQRRDFVFYTYPHDITNSQWPFRMAKDAYYFSHDYDPLGDPKMQAMVAEFGGLGYGIFWRIAEMLHADSDHKLALKPYVFKAIAIQMKTEPEYVENFINRSINEFELFASDASFLWSRRVIRNIDEKGSKRSKKVEAGKKGGINSGKSRKSKQNEASLQANEVTSSRPEANEAKERKGKESIESPSNLVTTTTGPPEVGGKAVVAAAKLAWDDQAWREQVCMANYFQLEDLRQWMYMYNASLTADTMPDFTPSKYKKMFNGWLQRKKQDGYKLPEKQQNGQSSQLRTIS